MPKHILVAEDEALVGMLLEDILVEAGHRVTVAANGEKALAAWREDRADLVVTDLSMPGMNGVDLVRYLRGMDASLPVLVVTGSAELTPGAESMVASDPERSAVLVKPAKPAEIQRQVARLLSQVRSSAVPVASHAEVTGW